MKQVVKRVVGLPGEQVGERNGAVYVNGRRLAEPYLAAGVVTDCSLFRSSCFPAGRIPAGFYFVLGDNRMNSKDSRFFGPVSGEDIVAVATRIVSPSERAGRIAGSPR